MSELLTTLPLAAVVVAVFWLLRRMPAVRCPFCGSRDWVILDQIKQCSQCGRLF